MQELRPYQNEALHRLRAGIRAGNKAQVLMMATGSGKTSVASHIMAGASQRDKRAFFIVDSIELVDQAWERFENDGMSVGIIQGDHWETDYSRPIQVATIQTLKNRWPRLAREYLPDVLVIDECHVIHQAHIDVINWCKAEGVPVVGLSATPFRKGMGEHFDNLIIGATTQFLTDSGFLVPATCYAPFVPDLKGVKTTTNGDWQEDALAEFMGDADIVGDIIENWLKYGENRQTLAFGANVAHSRMMMDKFRQAGVVAEHIDGYDTDKNERARKIREFRNGNIKVLCNCAVLTKGFDAPETGCVILARPTKSLMLHIQQIGRGLRPAPGKQNCIILDHAGNCLRNGLPTDDLPESLHDGKVKDNPDRKQREKDEPVPKPCSSCGFVSTKHKCPACGFAPEARKDVEVRDGELYEIGENKPKKMKGQELSQFYAELKGYAMKKGHNLGWAYHKCREYAGSHPRDTRTIRPVDPSEKTLAIVKHLNIKNAKARGGRRA